MNALIQALKIIVRFFEKQKMPYMLIGGLANSIYGNPRQTFDIDIKIELNESEYSEFFSELAKVASIIPPDPAQFLQEAGVIPAELAGVRVDLIKATLPYELNALQRSKIQSVFGVQVNITSAEDLVIQKAISPRDRDWMDIEGIVENMGKDLDWSYILVHLRELSEFLSDSTIYDKIEKVKDAAKL